jgi:hypothetical protein
MSAINEAYARIDYAYLKSLETSIKNLEQKINSLIEAVGGTNRRFISKRVAMNDKNSTQKITFSPAFPERPTVTFAIQDNGAVLREVVITELNTEFVKFNVVRTPGQKPPKKTSGGFTLHFIAIGKKE